MEKNRNKRRTTAIILAIFLGIWGAHRFYLGQIGLGILYVFLSFTGISFILSVIDIVLFAVRGEEDFNRKYNEHMFDNDYSGNSRIRNRRNKKRKRKSDQRSRKKELKKIKQEGIKQFKQYDVEEAIDTFQEALSISDEDVSVHFNLACSYSICEDKERAYAHLSRAVELGFDDYEKIMEHDALAYLRIQDDWDAFRQNGFRIPQKSLKEGKGPNLLDELRHLDQLKEEGHLSLEEFRNKKKELLKKKEEKE